MIKFFPGRKDFFPDTFRIQVRNFWRKIERIVRIRKLELLLERHIRLSEKVNALHSWEFALTRLNLCVNPHRMKMLMLAAFVGGKETKMTWGDPQNPVVEDAKKLYARITDALSKVKVYASLIKQPTNENHPLLVVAILFVILQVPQLVFSQNKWKTLIAEKLLGLRKMITAGGGCGVSYKPLLKMLVHR